MREPAIPTFRACATALASLLLAVGRSDSRPGGGARPDERSQAHAGRPPLDSEDYLFVDDGQDRRAPNSWVTDQAMVWIRERDTRPLFLFIHYYDVHSDYSSLPQYERLFVQPYSEVADGTGWQLARANRSIRRGRYKLIHNSKEDSWALYDLELDPGETLDIAAKEPEITAELSAEIRSRYAGFDPNPEPPNRIELDREELERLRALGYVP